MCSRIVAPERAEKVLHLSVLTNFAPERADKLCNCALECADKFCKGNFTPSREAGLVFEYDPPFQSLVPAYGQFSVDTKSMFWLPTKFDSYFSQSCKAVSLFWTRRYLNLECLRMFSVSVDAKPQLCLPEDLESYLTRLY